MMSEQQRDVPLEVVDKCSESDEVMESLPSCHPGAATPGKLDYLKSIYSFNKINNAKF